MFRIGMAILVAFVSVCAGQTVPPNLDFEQGSPGDVPPGWFVPKTLLDAGYNALSTREGCRTGSCVVITVPATRPANMFGNLMRTIDAEPYRGKRVLLRAAIRIETSDPAGQGAMWMRVDLAGGAAGFFDNMTDRPIRSSSWSFYEITGVVDVEAISISFGVTAFGDARVWVDDISLGFTDLPPDTTEAARAREQIQMRYAEIDSAYNTRNVEALRSLATSDATFGSPMMKLSLNDAVEQMKSVLRDASNVASKTEITSFQFTADEVSVRTRATMTLTIEGSTTVRESLTSDTWVRSNGRWLLKQGFMLGSREVVPPTDVETTRRIAAALNKQAVPLITAEAGHPHTDLEAFGSAIGDARIVSLGEATHGTREIFQMKHRLLEYLVQEKGFTVFAIEANWPESQTADRYIKTGEGDPRAALARMYFWTWYTEEVLAMLEWMRAFNEAPGDHPILSFTSFDMQTYEVARDGVIEYVERHAPGDLAVVKTAYSTLFTLQSRVRTDPGFDEAATKAEGVVSLLEARQDSLVTASSADAFRNAVQMARIVAQAARMRSPGAGGSFRDQMMAKNVEWLAREAYPKEKIVLWAHNGHVNKAERSGFRPMGAWLRESLGSTVYVLGFAINKGMVRAVTTEGERRIGLVESKIPPAAGGTGTAVLSSAGLSMFFLDLRNRSGELAKWLAEPHLFRSCGASWDRNNPDSSMQSEILNASYDGLVYMENTQATRGLSAP